MTVRTGGMGRWGMVALVTVVGCADGESLTSGFSSFSGTVPMTAPPPASETGQPTSGDAATVGITEAAGTAGMVGTDTSGDAATGSSSGAPTEGGTTEATTAVLASCGDGIVDVGEACDDGNSVDTDECLSTCVVASCGDGFVEAGVEACDDGNTVDDDACTNMCASVSCGDGMMQMGEVCDDGNLVDTDACTTACMPAACGDGFVHAGVEACDDKAATAACDADCTAPACGDGVVNAAAGEACDDGNTVATDACTAVCKAAACGDGVVQGGVEQCDDGNGVDNDACTNLCKNGGCVPNGQRAPFNALSLDTASGCWSGTPCDNDQYNFSQLEGQNFQAFGEAIACQGPATCVAHVGVGTYDQTIACQGRWDVLCDGVAVGTIDTNGKTCTGSSMANGCSVAFAARACATIQLTAAADNDGTLGCCNGTGPDSMIVAVSAW